MGLIRSFFNNTRKPTGLRGRLMLSRMNAEHAAVSDWGMAQLPATSPHSIAELGCGGGRNAAELLRRYPDASLTAIDYSPESVGRTARVNAAEVASGRCRTLQADVSDLPLPDDSFDLVTAFETVYFWPGPVASLREVLRVLKPGGTLLVVNEADGAPRVCGYDPRRGTRRRTRRAVLPAHAGMILAVIGLVSGARVLPAHTGMIPRTRGTCSAGCASCAALGCS